MPFSDARSIICIAISIFNAATAKEDHFSYASSMLALIVEIYALRLKPINFVWLFWCGTERRIAWIDMANDQKINKQKIQSYVEIEKYCWLRGEIFPIHVVLFSEMDSPLNRDFYNWWIMNCTIIFWCWSIWTWKSRWRPFNSSRDVN